MKLECRKCKKEFDYYRMDRINLVFDGDEVNLRIDVVCERCGKYTNYLSEEMITRARCLNVLNAEVIKPVDLIDNNHDRKNPG